MKHTLRVKTLVSHAGMKGRIVKLVHGKCTTQNPTVPAEWYSVDIYGMRENGKPLPINVLREYLIAR